MSDRLMFNGSPVIGEYKMLNEGDVVRVVIAEFGIDADFRVVCEPDLEQDDVWHYSLHPAREARDE